MLLRPLVQFVVCKFLTLLFCFVILFLNFDSSNKQGFYVLTCKMIYFSGQIKTLYNLFTHEETQDKNKVAMLKIETCSQITLLQTLSLLKVNKFLKTQLSNYVYPKAYPIIFTLIKVLFCNSVIYKFSYFSPINGIVDISKFLIFHNKRIGILH